MAHGLFNVKRYDLIRDAAYVAELRAELYGDPYTVVEVGGGLGFTAIRTGDLDSYNVQPWQIHNTAQPDRDTPSRRLRLNEMLRAATDEAAAS
jgi:hypothetical protein